jgi:hypothetical protein
VYEERGGPFPEIWHQSSCHGTSLNVSRAKAHTATISHANHPPLVVIGLQHHLLADLFLATFDPHMPRIGVHRKFAEEAMTVRHAFFQLRPSWGLATNLEAALVATDSNPCPQSVWHRTRQPMVAAWGVHGLYGHRRV